MAASQICSCIFEDVGFGSSSGGGSTSSTDGGTCSGSLNSSDNAILGLTLKAESHSEPGTDGKDEEQLSEEGIDFGKTCSSDSD